ncbi:MAG: hypothetical protein F4187_09850, partial [Gemmatimonadetes bacterium]|nr:hypothetical protein [Gemmatimonadota bacterium]
MHDGRTPGGQPVRRAGAGRGNRDPGSQPELQPGHGLHGPGRLRAAAGSRAGEGRGHLQAALVPARPPAQGQAAGGQRILYGDHNGRSRRAAGAGDSPPLASASGRAAALQLIRRFDMRGFGPTTFVAVATLILAPAWNTPFAGPALAQESGDGAMTVDEVIDMVRVSGPRLSPDGSRILFTKSELDWDENKRESRIWVVGPDGEGMRPFTGSTDDRSPEWSPDGRWVSFTRPVGEGESVRQLFVLPTDGGEAIQLTTHGTAVGRYRWSDDSGSILFLASDSLPDETEKERKKGDDAVFIDEGPNGQTRGNWNGVWTVQVDVEEAPVQASRLTAEGRIVGDFAPSPDGNHLAYTYRTENRRNAGHLSEIAILSTVSGDEELLTANDAPESQLAWSPDGASITFVAPDLESWELDQGNLFLHHIPTGETRQLMADVDADMRGYRWTAGGRSIDIVALDRTDANLYRLNVRSDELEPLTDLSGIVSGPSFDRFHDKAAIQFASPSEPGDLWLVDLGDGSRTRLTTANPWLEEKTLAEPEDAEGLRDARRRL